MRLRLHFPSFRAKERVDILLDLGLSTTQVGDEIEVRDNPAVNELIGPMLEIARVVADPTYKFDSSRMPAHYRIAAIRLVHQFQCFYENIPHIDIEVEIAKAIKQHIAELECSCQDEWLGIEASDIKHKLNNDILNKLLSNLSNDECILWDRVHAKIWA